jgi:hypothetical protein
VRNRLTGAGAADAGTVLPSPHRRRAPVPGPLGGVLGFVAGIGAQCLAWTFGASVVTITGVVFASAAAAAVGASTDAGGAALTALLCWAFSDGFALHRYGELHLGAADRHALVAVAAAGAVAYLVGLSTRRAGMRVPLPRPAPVQLPPARPPLPMRTGRPVGAGRGRLCP